MNLPKGLGEEKVLPLVLKFSFVAFLALLMYNFNEFVDQMYIATILESLGEPGSIDGYFLYQITTGFVLLIGFGASLMVSIRLGEGKKEEAEQILGQSVLLLVGIGVIIGVLSFFFLKPLFNVINLRPEIYRATLSYMSVILPGCFFYMLGLGLSVLHMAVGNPLRAFGTAVLFFVLNAALTPIFVGYLDWGVRGVALATVTAQAFACFWALAYFLDARSPIMLRISNCRLQLGLVIKIFAYGFVPAVVYCITELTNFLENLIFYYGSGTSGAISFEMLNFLMAIVFMFIFAICLGIQPIIGYNVGARKVDRVKRTFEMALVSAAVVTVLGYIILLVMPEKWIGFFVLEPRHLAEVVDRLPLYTSVLPLVGVRLVGMTYFFAAGKPVQGGVLGLSKVIANLLVGVYSWVTGSLGYYLSDYYIEETLMLHIVAEIIGIVLTAILLYPEYQRLKRSCESQAIGM